MRTPAVLLLLLCAFAALFFTPVQSTITDIMLDSPAQGAHIKIKPTFTIKVLVRDETQSPVSGASVSVTSDASWNGAAPPSVVTGADGFASFTIDVTTTGDAKFTFTAADPAPQSVESATPLDVDLVLEPGDTIALASDTATFIAKTNFDFELTVLDASEVLSNDCDGQVATITDLTGTATLSGNGQVTVTNGVAQWTTLQFDNVGDFQLEFKVSNIDLTHKITVVGGPATALAFKTQPGGNPTGPTGGIAFPTQPVAQLKDANGFDSPTENIEITIAVSTGEGTLSGKKTCTTDATGSCAFTDLSINTAGTYVLSLSSGTLISADSASFAVAVGPIAKIVFVGTVGDGLGGAPLATAPKIQVKDAGDNNVPEAGHSIFFSLTLSGGSTSPVEGTYATEADGSFTLTGYKVDKIGMYTLTVTDNTVPAATSNTFEVKVGPAAAVAFSTEPVASTGGLVFSTQPVVQLKDLGGNDATGSDKTISIDITGSVTELGGTKAGVTDAQGKCTFTDLAINLVGTYTLTVTAELESAVSAVSQTVVVAAGPANSFKVTTQPAGCTGGSVCATQPAVQFLDKGGNNAVSNFPTVTLAIKTSPIVFDGKLTYSSATTDGNGLSTFSGVKIDKIGSYVLTASATGFSDVDTSSFFVSVGQPSQLSFATEPADVEVNKVLGSVVVVVEDAGGNTVPAAIDVTIALTVPGTATLTGGKVTSKLGVATFSDLSIDTEDQFSLTASGGGFTVQSSPFTVLGHVTLSSVSNFVINAQSSDVKVTLSSAAKSDADFTLSASPDSKCTFSGASVTDGVLTVASTQQTATFTATCTTPNVGVMFSATAQQTPYTNGFSNEFDVKGTVSLSGEGNIVVSSSKTMTITIDPVSDKDVSFDLSSTGAACMFAVNSHYATSVVVKASQATAQFDYGCSLVDKEAKTTVSVSTSANYQSQESTSFGVTGTTTLDGASDVIINESSQQVTLVLTPATTSPETFVISASAGKCTFTGDEITDGTNLAFSTGEGKATFTYSCAASASPVVITLTPTITGAVAAYTTATATVNVYDVSVIGSFTELMTGVCSNSMQVNVSPAAASNINLGLSSADGHCTFYSDAQCDRAVANGNVVISSGSSQSSELYVKCTSVVAAQSITLTPSPFMGSTIAGKFTTSTFAVSTYGFVGLGNTLTQTCSGPAAVSIITSGNLLSTLNVGLTSLSGCLFYSDACVTSTSSVSVAAAVGQSHVSTSFYYKCPDPIKVDVNAAVDGVQSTLTAYIDVATYEIKGILGSIAKGTCSASATVSAAPTVTVDTKVGLEMSCSCKIYTDVDCSSPAVDHVVISANLPESPAFYYMCSDVTPAAPAEEKLIASPNTYVTRVATSFTVNGLTQAPPAVVAQKPNQKVTLPGSSDNDNVVFISAEATCPTSSAGGKVDGDALTDENGDNVFVIQNQSVSVSASALGMYKVCYRAALPGDAAKFADTGFMLDVRGVSSDASAVIKQVGQLTVELNGSTDGDVVVITLGGSCSGLSSDTEALVDLAGNHELTVTTGSVKLVPSSLGKHRICYRLAHTESYVDTTFMLDVRGMSSAPTPVAKQDMSIKVALTGSSDGDQIVFTTSNCPTNSEDLSTGKFLRDADGEKIVTVTNGAVQVQPAATGEYNVCYQLAGKTDAYVQQYVLSVRGVNKSSPVARSIVKQTILLDSSVDGDKVVITKDECPTVTVNDLGDTDFMRTPDNTTVTLVVSGGAVEVLPAELGSYNICYQPANSDSSAFVNQGFNVTVTGVTAVSTSVLARSDESVVVTLTSANNGQVILATGACPDTQEQMMLWPQYTVVNETLTITNNTLGMNGVYTVCYRPADLTSSLFVSQGFNITVRGVNSVSPSTFVRSVYTESIALHGSTNNDLVVFTTGSCPATSDSYLNITEGAVTTNLAPGTYFVCYQPAGSSAAYVKQPNITLYVHGATEATPNVLSRSSQSVTVVLQGANVNDAVVFTTAFACPTSNEQAEKNAASSLLTETNSAIHTLALRQAVSTAANIIVIGNSAAVFSFAALGQYRVCYKISTAGADEAFIDQGVSVTVRGVSANTVRVASTTGSVTQDIGLPGSTLADSVVLTKSSSCPQNNAAANADSAALPKGGSNVLVVNDDSAVTAGPSSVGTYKACYKTDSSADSAFILQENFSLVVAGLSSLSSVNKTFAGSAFTATLGSTNVVEGDKVVLTTASSCPQNDKSADTILYVKSFNNTLVVSSTFSASAVGNYRACYKTLEAATDAPFYLQGNFTFELLKPLSASSVTAPSLLVLLVLAVAWIFV